MLDILRACAILEKLVKQWQCPTHASRLRSPRLTVHWAVRHLPYLFIVPDYVLRKAIGGREEELGFTLVRCQSQRVAPVNIIDLDFADDIALVSHTVEQARTLLLSYWGGGSEDRTASQHGDNQVLAYNTTNATVHTRDGMLLQTPTNFKYLCCHIDSSEKDLRTRRGLAWSALHNMKKVWTSTLSTRLKRSLFLPYHTAWRHGPSQPRPRSHWMAAIPDVAHGPWRIVAGPYADRWPLQRHAESDRQD